MTRSIKILLAWALALAFASIGQAWAEQKQFPPALDLSGEAAALTDLFGQHGNQLCVPTAITHGLTYLRQAGHSLLGLIPDMDGDGRKHTYQDQIRYFFHTCRSDRDTGTNYQSAVECLREYTEESGYQAYAYMIGPHATEAPAGRPLSSTRHGLRPRDFKNYLSGQFLVLLGVGWYERKAGEHFRRVGGHMVNLYGYRHERDWGDARMELTVVNPRSSYRGREKFDTVQMNRISPRELAHAPSGISYELSGEGFGFSQRAFVEDLIVLRPQ